MTRNNIISIARVGFAIAGLTVHAAERAVESAFAPKGVSSSIAGSPLPAQNEPFGNEVRVRQRGDTSLALPAWCVDEDAIYRTCPGIPWLRLAANERFSPTTGREWLTHAHERLQANWKSFAATPRRRPLCSQHWT
jgi:hypothetical protein